MLKELSGFQLTHWNYLIIFSPSHFCLSSLPLCLSKYVTKYNVFWQMDVNYETKYIVTCPTHARRMKNPFTLATTPHLVLMHFKVDRWWKCEKYIRNKCQSNILKTEIWTFANNFLFIFIYILFDGETFGIYFLEQA